MLFFDFEQMGFDVEIKTNGKMGIDNIDFVVSGKALNPVEQQQAMMSASMGDIGGMEGGGATRRGRIPRTGRLANSGIKTQI